MSNFATKVVEQLLLEPGAGFPSSAVAEKAGELLGHIGGMWIHASLYDFLERQGGLDEEGIIAAIISWETQNPDKLADTALRAFGPRDGRLGHIPPAQRKLFSKEFAGRCPQCGAIIEEEEEVE